MISGRGVPGFVEPAKQNLFRREGRESLELLQTGAHEWQSRVIGVVGSASERGNTRGEAVMEVSVEGFRLKRP